jgi:predicted aconitase
MVDMYLTNKEERILDGELGTALARAMRLLVCLGDLGDADRLVPIKRSQIAGISYKTAGDPTLELVESLAQEKARVRTRASLNPAGMDLNRWKDMGIPETFAEKQLRICEAYGRLGATPSCTCTPYLSGNKPSFGETVGFSESSAIAFVNSVIGARTNRHGGLDALSAALVGKVPRMGYLLDENRVGTTQVLVNFRLKSEADYSALGYFVGKRVKTDEVPVFQGIKSASMDELKLLGAASAASGSVALFHIIGLTPEASLRQVKDEARHLQSEFRVGKDEILSVYRELNADGDPDLVAVGCPHCSIREIALTANLLSGRKVKKKIKFWVFASPQVVRRAERSGYVDKIRLAGGDVFCHTCMVVAPIEDLGFRCVYTNSAKAAFYISRMTQGECSAKLLSLEDCVKLCTT